MTPDQVEDTFRRRIAAEIAVHGTHPIPGQGFDRLRATMSLLTGIGRADPEAIVAMSDFASAGGRVTLGGVTFHEDAFGGAQQLAVAKLESGNVLVVRVALDVPYEDVSEEEADANIVSEVFMIGPGDVGFLKGAL